jgi:hypothetical protein
MFSRNISVHVYTAFQLHGQRRVCSSAGICHTVSQLQTCLLCSLHPLFEPLFFASGTRSDSRSVDRSPATSLCWIAIALLSVFLNRAVSLKMPCHNQQPICSFLLQVPMHVFFLSSCKLTVHTCLGS